MHCNHYVKIIIFTVLQASIVTILSIFISIFLFYFIKKLKYNRYKNIFENLINIPYYLPSLIGCACIILLLGKNGIVAKVFKLLNIKYSFQIYGLNGIIITQMFYYIPLCLRNLSRSINNIASQYERLKTLYNINNIKYYLKIELNFLKNEILSLFILIFMYSINCFSIALMFGAKPTYTTLSILIYKTINIDLNSKIAIRLCLVQFLINLGLFYVFRKFRSSNKIKFFKKFSNLNTKFKVLDYVVIISLVVLIVTPLFLIIIKGISNRYFF